MRTKIHGFVFVLFVVSRFFVYISIYAVSTSKDPNRSSYQSKSTHKHYKLTCLLKKKKTLLIFFLRLLIRTAGFYGMNGRNFNFQLTCHVFIRYRFYHKYLLFVQSAFLIGLYHGTSCNNWNGRRREYS